MMAVTEIPCPSCGVNIPLEKHPDKPDIVIAYHDCGRRGRRPVYESVIKPAPAKVQKEE
jgi:hypothetical protein